MDKRWFKYHLTNSMPLVDLHLIIAQLKKYGSVEGKDYVIKGRGNRVSVWTLGKYATPAKETYQDKAKSCTKKEIKEWGFKVEDYKLKNILKQCTK